MDNKLSDLPPLGKFFDPFHGYLALTNSDDLPNQDMFFESLNDSVTVVWDERRIPQKRNWTN